MISIRNMSIKRRVLVLMLAASIFVSVSVSAVAIILSLRYMRESLLKDLTSMAEMVGDNCQVSIVYNIPDDTGRILASLKRRPSISYAAVVDTNGDVFASYHSALFGAGNIPRGLLYTKKKGSRFEHGHLHVWDPIIFDGRVIGTLHLYDNMQLIKEASRAGLLIIGLIVIAVTLGLYFLTLGFHKLISNPIIRLSEVARKVYASEDYELRAKHETGGEIGVLVDAFNEMLEHIHRANRRLEAVVSELEDKNMELERFTYTVSHELKSPLITIKGFLGQLRKHLEKDPQRVEKDMLRIENAADKMYELLNDLLELSRVGRISGEVSEVSFNELVDEALARLDAMISESGVRIEVQEDMPRVTVDTTRFTEVLQNLLENACKFTKGQSNPKISVGCRNEGNQTVFFVSDNGIGIEPEYRERVFGLFEQLDHKLGGTGIGLALIKRIVEIHNGRIWIEDGPDGSGTTFCFTINEKPHARGSEEKRTNAR